MIFLIRQNYIGEALTQTQPIIINLHMQIEYENKQVYSELKSINGFNSLTKYLFLVQALKTLCCKVLVNKKPSVIIICFILMHDQVDNI